MACYKVMDRSPHFLPVILDAQLMPGSFEFAFDYLIDNERISPVSTKWAV